MIAQALRLGITLKLRYPLMAMLFTLKDMIILGVSSLAISILLPLLMVSLLTLGRESTEVESLEISEAPVLAQTDTSEQGLINACRSRIGKVTAVDATAIRIERRSTGFRGERFNVHGVVTQGGSDYLFECWFNPDRSFESETISRNSLQDLRRKSALNPL